MYEVVISRTGTRRSSRSSKAGMSRRRPDHLMNDTRMSTWSADLISLSSSWASCGSCGEPVNSELSTSGVCGRGMPDRP